MTIQRCDNYDCPKRKDCWYAMVGNMFLWCPVVECVDYSAYKKCEMEIQQRNEGAGMTNDRIKEIAKKNYEINDGNGWHERYRSDFELRMLASGELHEAVECIRNGEPVIWIGENKDVDYASQEGYEALKRYAQQGYKPEGIAVELGDCVLRLLDWMVSHSDQARVEKIIDAKGQDKLDAIGRFTIAASNGAIEKSTLIEDIASIDMVLTVNVLLSDFKYKKLYYLFEVVNMIRRLSKDYDYPLEKAIDLKLEYNKTRGYKHGKTC